MSKLLYANMMRLKKTGSFWVGFLIMLASGVLIPVIRYTDMKKSGYIAILDNGFFGCALFIGIVMAVFCSLFIGTEYSDGTIRNKIVVGQKRFAIYLSNGITSAAVGLLMCAAFFLPFLVIGIPLLGFFAADLKLVLWTVLTVFLLAIAFSSVFTLIAMLCQNKAIVAVICILLAFGCLMTGSILKRILDAPKTVPSYTMGEDKEPILTEEPNPKYLEGTKREIVQTFYDIIPGGQAIQCASMEMVNLPVLPVYSVIITGVATVTGVLVFRKKDLK